MTPLELLQQELIKWEKALLKSKQAFDNDFIPELVYKEHKANLEPKIQEYVYAVKILEYFIIPSIT